MRDLRGGTLKIALLDCTMMIDGYEWDEMGVGGGFFKALCERRDH